MNIIKLIADNTDKVRDIIVLKLNDKEMADQNEPGWWILDAVMKSLDVSFVDQPGNYPDGVCMIDTDWETFMQFGNADETALVNIRLR